MLFNSATFWIFFAAFLGAWWLARSSLPARNALILVASYVFYGWWDYRFLALIVFSTLLDYAVGLRLGATDNPRARKGWVACSIIGNLGMLGFFKYWNFFQDSAVTALAQLGLQAHPFTLQVVLPVGISFYTFQTMSYTLDVYRREMVPTRDWLSFAAYVAFFPQLVAGPIERARRLLPQFQQTRTITAQAVGSGIDLIIWGLFKKVVIADGVAPFVDAVFAGHASGLLLQAMATVVFGFQIYCDFSGYSDIARGLARVLGFDLMVNFDRPYTAKGLREFWRRWHISLSSWLRDYLYLSLGGNRGGRWRTLRNVWITLLLGGLWHGAGWPFIAWGAWHALGLSVEHMTASRHKNAPSPFAYIGTLCWVFVGWYLFRLPSLSALFTIDVSLTWPIWAWDYVAWAALWIVPMLWLERYHDRRGGLPGEAPTTTLRGRAFISGLLLYLVLTNAPEQAAPFIYFQF